MMKYNYRLQLAKEISFMKQLRRNNVIRIIMNVFIHCHNVLDISLNVIIIKDPNYN